MQKGRAIARPFLFVQMAGEVVGLWGLSQAQSAPWTVPVSQWATCWGLASLRSMALRLGQSPSLARKQPEKLYANVHPLRGAPTRMVRTTGWPRDAITASIRGIARSTENPIAAQAATIAATNKIVDNSSMKTSKNT